MDFEIENVVAVAIFRKPITNMESTAIFRSIPEEWTTHLRGEPDFMPFGSGFPPDFPIPLMQFKNEDSSKVIQITRLRIEAGFSKKSSETLEIAKAMNFALDRFSEIWNSLEKAGIGVNRFAVVVKRISSAQFTPKALVDRFCNDAARNGPFRRPESFEIHAHKVFNAGFASLNSWVRNCTAKRIDNQLEVVTVEQDMNSLIGEADKSGEDLRTFFSSIAETLEDCFQVYYPAELKS